MKGIFRVALLLFVLGVTGVALWSQALTSWPPARAPARVPSVSLAAVEAETVALFRRSAPAVVHVFAQAGTFAAAEDGSEGAQQTGSGFLWDAQGHIITNEHVVRGAQLVRVRLADGTIREGKVIGRAAQVDLAIIRIDDRSLPAALPVGSSASLAVGQFAMAIGNPFGFDQTMTTGAVSALKRRLPTDGGREIADMIQTDAAINPGNSGGPLIDSSGRVIGVATAIYSPSGTSAGIGFAVPIDTVKRVAPILIQNGRLPTPAIGVAIVSEAIAARLGIDGLVVASVVQGSPAQRAGVRGIDKLNGILGDVIVSVDGKPVRRLAELAEALETVGVDRQVRIGIVRNEREIPLTMKTIDNETAR